MKQIHQVVMFPTEKATNIRTDIIKLISSNIMNNPMKIGSLSIIGNPFIESKGNIWQY